MVLESLSGVPGTALLSQWNVVSIFTSVARASQAQNVRELPTPSITRLHSEQTVVCGTTAPRKVAGVPKLSNELKKGYCENVQLVKQTLHSHFGSQQVPRLNTINASIVDKIIGDMLWDLDEVEGESHTNMMQPFVEISDESEDLKDGEGGDLYRIDIKSSL
uniref:Uncharacterized protein n=1 Tax=Hyaloperonospora arabidopsidis (strain Emoy2) TaxID=559515 RepID=M4BS94_HYAAE